MDAAKTEIRKMKKETEATVTKLKADLTAKDTALKEHSEALQKFWDEYQATKASLRRCKRDLAQLQASREADLATITALEVQLQEARAQASPTHDEAAISADPRASTTACAPAPTLADLTRRLASATSDASFFRTRYQETDAFASSLRAEHAALTEELRRANAKLTFRELGSLNAAADNTAFQTLLGQKDREIAELSAQLESVMRGRGRGVNTRSGSQRPGGGGSPYASPARAGGGRVERVESPRRVVSPRRVAVGLGAGQAARRGRTLE